MNKPVNNSPTKLIKKNIARKKLLKKPSSTKNSKHVDIKYKYDKKHSTYKIKVISILDNYPHEWLKHECILIPITRNNWKEIIIKEKPQIFLVQSAFHGNNNEWCDKITNFAKRKDRSLIKVVNFCNQMKIPTVFWNIEDPYHFDKFIDAAKLFDYIFTTDCNSIQRYKNIVKHENVYDLMFAAQPKIHNPIGKDKNKIGNLAFAGSWYGKGHENRKKDMETVIKPSFKYNLDIYDRNYKRKSKNLKYPDIYKPYLKAGLPYNEMNKRYKKYDIFLNVNTVQKSPTMFACRIFELLACGTNMVSGYSIGIKKHFPNIVKLCKTPEDTRENIEVLLKDKILRDKLSLLGQREVFNKHTYRRRIEKVFDNIGIKYKKKQIPGVTFFAYAKDKFSVKNIIQNYNNQKYIKKELIIMVDNKSSDFSNYEKNHIKIIKTNKAFLKNNFSYIISKSNYCYIAKFRENNYYSPYFINDIINTLNYSKANIIGKNSYYIYSKSNKSLYLCKGNENSYVNKLHIPTIVFNKNIFNKQNINISNIKTYIELLALYNKNNIKFYSNDKFNYLFEVNDLSEIKDNNSIIKIKQNISINIAKDYITV